MGRTTEYTPEIGDRICELVANSEHGLRKTLQGEPGMPDPATVYEWRQNYVEFDDKFAQAKRHQIEMMAEDIVDLSNDGSLDPNDKRIRVDTRKWLLSKLLAKTYGDKLDVTSGGEALSTPPHLIDARVQSIIMQARIRKLGVNEALDLSPEALKLLD